MNRIRLNDSSQSAMTSAKLRDQIDSFDHFEPRRSDHLFLPASYEPNYDYPVIVWLHGDGGNQNQVCQMLPLVSVQNYVGIGVRGSRATDSLGHGFSWLHSEAGIAIAEQSVFDAIDAVSNLHCIDHSRIFVAGLEAGGTMAYRIALRHPNLFAGAISLGGCFPRGVRPLANYESVKDLPLLMALGSDDAGYPTEHVCEDLKMLHSARMSMQLRQYDTQELLSADVLRDVNQWVMGHITGQDTLAAAVLSDTVPVEFSCN